jgi:aspartate carbamoyltransferase catalytic subunit
MDVRFDGWPHVICAQQFSREWLENCLFPQADEMKAIVESGGNQILSRKRMVALFYEPSTRTRFSFEFAMSYLGGTVFQTENAREFSSAVKGETLSDSIRVLCRYRPNVIVMRHHEEGSAELAAQVSNVPVINAGDGRGQHPTQALLDIYTIYKRLRRIDGIVVAMVGDLVNGRTVRSLSYLLSKFKDVKILFTSPLCARMKSDIKEYLDAHKVTWFEGQDIRDVASEVDVIYQTRTQKERGSSFGVNSDGGYFLVDRSVVELMKQNAIVMHPLPRVDEITTDVDDDPRAVYLTDQVESGLYVRMALLKTILNPPIIDF